VTLALRQLPSVDRLLGLAPVQALAAEHGRVPTTNEIRTLLAELRARLADNEAAGEAAIDEERLVRTLAARLARAARPNLRRVFNLTGTVLHTNLGRAPLAEEAIAAAVSAMRHPVNLEYDLERGRRGERDSAVEALLAELTGAEAAVVLNNNAAAVLIALNTFGARREAIVSRGELIEIGGAFRIPDIMQRAGTQLREVGTTNRTHLADYADAIGAKTTMLLKVHTSNYAVVGFTSAVGINELAPLAQSRGLVLMEDLGSGTLIDLARYGLPHEPTPRESIDAGADLVTFSGDKLLGGPQCGLIVGRRKLVDRIRKNPLKRSLRVDKVTLAALEATLRLYADPDRLAARLPTLQLLTRAQHEIRDQAERLRAPLAEAVGTAFVVTVQDVRSQIGSGARPLDLLPSAALAITPADPRKGAGRALAKLEQTLRALPIPVIGHIERDTLLLDLRCLDDEAAWLAQLERLSGSADLLS
jgi:L-seryl-tRNA(Ser) seleniumtransferase